LRDAVEKPKEPPPAWALPPQEIDPDSDHARDYRLRQENTKGTREYNAATDVYGTKRAANGRIIAKTTLREDADKPKPRKSEYDDTRGYTVDKEYGVRTAEEAESIQRFEEGQRADRAAADQKYETDRHNDAVAAVEVNPPTYVEPGPVTLPNPNEG
jgi:hypothetical protein